MNKQTKFMDRHTDNATTKLQTSYRQTALHTVLQTNRQIALHTVLQTNVQHYRQTDTPHKTKYIQCYEQTHHTRQNTLSATDKQTTLHTNRLST